MITRFPMRFRFNDTPLMALVQPAVQPADTQNADTHTDKPVRVRAHRRKLPGRNSEPAAQPSETKLPMGHKSIGEMLMTSLTVAQAFADRLSAEIATKSASDAQTWRFLSMDELQRNYPNHVIVANVFGSSTMFFACLLPGKDLVIVSI